MSTPRSLHGAGAPPAPRLDGPVRLVLLVLVVVLIASAIRNLREHGDFRGYLEVGELVLQGRDVYADARPGTSTWPPLFPVLCVPFALLARVSVYLARALWFALNVAAMVAILRSTVRLVYHRELALRPGPDAIGLASLAVIGPLVLSSRFLLGNLDRLQINVLMLFACLAGATLIVRGRAAAGGAVVGLAAAVKVLPVFFVPYFAWKGWWRACAAALVAGAVASAAPIVVFGPARFARYVQEWLAIAGGGWPVRKGNQSVYAMVDRLWSHGDVLYTPAARRIVAADDPVVAVMVYGLLALVVLAFVCAARRGGEDPGSPAVAVEVATVLAVAPLFSPLAWKHYFVLLLPAWFVLWRAAFVADATVPGAPPYGVAPRDRRVIAVLLGVACVLMLLLVRGLVGKQAALVFETRSVITLGGLLVLGALLHLRRRLASPAGA